jgi:hypothetical protein
MLTTNGLRLRGVNICKPRHWNGSSQTDQAENNAQRNSLNRQLQIGLTRSARSPSNSREINLFPVIADSRYDVEGEGQRPAAVFEGNGGRGTMTHRMQE